MPVYVFSCDNKKCRSKGKPIELFMHASDYKIPVCKKCGDQMIRKFNSEEFSFTVDFKPGFDVGLGEYCDTKKQRDDFVEKKNLRRVRT